MAAYSLDLGNWDSGISLLGLPVDSITYTPDGTTTNWTGFVPDVSGSTGRIEATFAYSTSWGTSSVSIVTPTAAPRKEDKWIPVAVAERAVDDVPAIVDIPDFI